VQQRDQGADQLTLGGGGSPAVELGLSLLDAGGDFADGVIAMAGSALGGDQLVTFDRQAAALLKRWGQKVVTL